MLSLSHFSHAASAAKERAHLLPREEKDAPEDMLLLVFQCCLCWDRPVTYIYHSKIADAVFFSNRKRLAYIPHYRIPDSNTR